MAVTDNRPYGSNTYYGRVAPDGAWQPGKYATPATLTAVTTLLAAFANNPSGIAADFGHLVGRCAFCGSDLTDERSVSVGFGPVCAKRWGMAWGKKLTGFEPARRFPLAIAARCATKDSVATGSEGRVRC